MRSVPFLVLLLCFGCIETVAAQNSSRPQIEGDPLELLLGIADEMELTAEQVRRIREIQVGLEQRNRPLVNRLVEIQQSVQAQADSSGSGGGSRGRPSRAHLEMSRPPMRQIQANNLDAMEEVGELLTDRQKEIADTLLDLPEPGRRGRRSRRQ
jgi:hypothetical protein